jgi:hypothetical protein
MTLAELIRSYHDRKLLPVFNKKRHALFLRECVPDYSRPNALPALDAFATANGFQLLPEDQNFCFVFAPVGSPYEDYTREVVPVDISPS